MAWRRFSALAGGWIASSSRLAVYFLFHDSIFGSCYAFAVYFASAPGTLRQPRQAGLSTALGGYYGLLPEPYSSFNALTGGIGDWPGIVWHISPGSRFNHHEAVWRAPEHFGWFSCNAAGLSCYAQFKQSQLRRRPPGKLLQRHHHLSICAAPSGACARLVCQPDRWPLMLR